VERADGVGPVPASVRRQAADRLLHGDPGPDAGEGEGEKGLRRGV
jgi:hypothetical protein